MGMRLLVSVVVSESDIVTLDSTKQREPFCLAQLASAVTYILSMVSVHCAVEYVECPHGSKIVSAVES